MEESRIGVYNYIYGLLYGVVTDNVYSMNEPQELTQSDTEDGFIVIRVGDMYDDSEFHGKAYGWVRVFVEAYIPPISRGRLNKSKYKYFEDKINDAINAEIDNVTNGYYTIESDGVLSMEDNKDTNANNAYYMFVKSFIVSFDNSNQQGYNLYIGYDGETISGIEQLNGLQSYYVDGKIGNYSIEIPTYSYLWVCSKRRIEEITSGHFVVPMEEPIEIDDLHCYRSSNKIMDDDMRIRILLY